MIVTWNDGYGMTRKAVLLVDNRETGLLSYLWVIPKDPFDQIPAGQPPSAFVGSGEMMPPGIPVHVWAMEGDGPGQFVVDPIQ